MRVSQFKGYFNPETGTFTFDTEKVYGAAHGLGQIFRDSQSQSGTAVSACGGTVSLSEWIEQFALRLVSDTASGIANPEAQYRTGAGYIFRVPLDCFNQQHNLANIGKLDRIADKIRQNLTQAIRVTTNRRTHVIGHLNNQLYPFGRGAFIKQIHHIFTQLPR